MAVHVQSKMPLELRLWAHAGQQGAAHPASEEDLGILESALVENPLLG
jgi:hypothetical protein